MASEAILSKILETVSALKDSQADLLSKVESYQQENRDQIKRLQDKVSASESHSRPRDGYKVHASEKGTAGHPPTGESDSDTESVGSRRGSHTSSTAGALNILSSSPRSSGLLVPNTATNSQSAPLYNHRIILTTYPGQVGINPIPLNWGNIDPRARGPVVASRNPSSLKKRNAIGAHGGSYSVYRALAIAIRELEPTHKPNLRNTDPVVKFGPYPSWGDPTKIVSLDPFGHVVADVFGAQLSEGIDVRPTIAITKAHMRVAEIETAVKAGRLVVDGHVVCNESGELMVVKGAVDPVWYLPGVAQRFRVDETTLRRALFEDTGGMYPELITRPDLKVFLPPIGGLSIYIFGNPEDISNPAKKLTVRVHDECNGSDVFGSDICTCRPYLIFGIEECVRSAQQGGVGLIVYFRKEGRALGEVTKYLVYNARKRAEGGDTAANYFLRTENVAGVKDMRFQALMPDVLHWLGITKIDRMISMSNMKYDAIVSSGIPILERIPIPADLLPPDSQVEIDAKIASGYFSTAPAPINLETTKGRTWDDINH